jgi:hypothetical protein
MKILAGILLSMVTITYAQPKILTTETLSYVGSVVGLSVSGVEGVASVSYNIDTSSRQVIKPVTVWTPKTKGYHKISAVIVDSSGKYYSTDTVGIYCASENEVSRMVLMAVTYQYKKTVFPDSAIVLPQSAIVISKSHSVTTLKTTLEYLNPLFK